MSFARKFARENRKTPTLEEAILWQILRDRGIKGRKVRRQYPIIYEIIGQKKKFFIADFYCARNKLIIELDGKHHKTGEQLQIDIMRTERLIEMGFKIIRIQNQEITDDLYGTLDRIENLL